MRSPLSPARSSLRPAQVAHRRSRSPLSPARRSLGPARVAHGQSQCSLRHNLEAHGDNQEGFSGNLRSHANRTRFSARAVAEPVLQDTDNGTLRVPIDSAAEPSVAWGVDFARFDAKLEQRLAELKSDLVKWMFAFWAPTALAVVALLLRK